jgi:hypothetical protein
LISRVVRVEGNVSSSKDSTSFPVNLKYEREGSAYKPHTLSLIQSTIQSVFKFEGKPPSGNESTSGSESNCKFCREGRRECMFSGNDFKYEQPSNTRLVKSGAASPPLGKDTKLRQ